MNKIKIILSLITFSFSSFSSEIYSQFERLQKNINSNIVKYEKDLNIEELSQGELRQSLFTIETLSKIYSQYHPELNEVERSTKGLEDAIGAYRKTYEQLSYAQQRGASKEKIEFLISQQKSGKQRLASYMSDTGWSKSIGGQSDKIQGIISKIDWGTEQQQRNKTYTLIANQLNQWAKTPWNMKELEGGVGIHDLRKEVRWYKLETNALSNMLGTHNESCAVSAIKPSSAKSGGKCLVSNCLHARIINTYDYFGQIKDEGEGLEGIGQHLSENKFNEVQAFYNKLRSEQIIEKLAQEYLSCIEN